MADALLPELGIKLPSIQATAGTLTTILWIVIGLVIITLGIGVIYFMLQFKHKLRVRDLTSGKKIIIDDLVREVKDKDGSWWWRLLKLKIKIPCPPSYVLDVDQKGHKVAECYRTSNDEFIFIQDDAVEKTPPSNLYDKIPSEITNLKDPRTKTARIKIWKQEKLETWRKENNAIVGFQPLTTNQRQILIGQIVKAHARKGKKWQDMIMPIVSMMALVVIVVSLMIFYEDMGKPLLAMADKQTGYETQITKQWEIMQSIDRNVQILSQEQLGQSTDAPPN